MLVVSQQSHVPEKGKFRMCVVKGKRASDESFVYLAALSHSLIYRRDAHTLKTKAARDDI
jgi:hypothetical protein